MTLFNIGNENFLENIVFSSLFFLFIFYWAQVSFFSTKKFQSMGSFVLKGTNFSIALFLTLRWIKSGHFPLSNLYESLLFLAWSLTACQLILEQKNKNIFIGAILSPLAFFTYLFATFSLPKEMQKTSALVPALQSNWLMMHVTIMMLSYAALLSGSVLAMAFLIVNWKDSKKEKFFQSIDSKKYQTIFPKIKAKSNDFISIINVEKSGVLNLKKTELINPLFFSSSSNALLEDEKNTKLNGVQAIPCIDKKEKHKEQQFSLLAQNLDNLSYRALGLGFPLLTIGILSGAVWANEAWGSYWSWDPKETWAFITWLVFAIYLHTRIMKGWVGKKPAIIATFGFIVVWFCYLGVNLLGFGLHSYGWFQT